MLEVAVFICGGVLMIFELVGSRVLAPYLGTSVVIWTNLIGIILGSLSIGYYVGGKIADRNPRYFIFAALILVSGICIGLTTLTYDIVLSLLTRGMTKNIFLESLIATMILFSPASIFLGMVSPYAVKLKLKSISVSGETVGRLYALSTMGSIVGTFFGGIFLIGFMGTKNILLLLSVTLVLTSLIFVGKSDLKKKRIAAAFWLIAMIWGTIGYMNSLPRMVVKDIDTAYNRIMIYDGKIDENNQPIRIMQLNNELSSAVFRQNDDLVFPYARYYRLVSYFKPDVKTALMIGGGAYTYPKDYLKQFPKSTMDVVEIDPAVTALAKEYFNLKDNPRLHIFHEDGRIFLNRTNKRYDVIFGDAFKSKVPPHTLTTREAVSEMHEKLNDDGVVLVNLITAFEGERGRFLQAEYKTFQSVFPHVYLYAVAENQPTTKLQNIMLVALKSVTPQRFSSNDPKLNKYLSRQWKKEVKSTLPILTDDFAPVEYYTMNSF